MTSNRPYRDAMPSRVARLRLAQAVESQFDTAVVAAFEAILAGATEDYRTGHGTEFDLLPASLTEEPSASDAGDVRHQRRRLCLVREQVEARDGFGSRSDAELFEDVSNVNLGGRLRDHQCIRYLSVAEPACHQSEDLALRGA